MPEIGETLRDARMRARIDVSEIEAKTKIRAKYLRALENEEWGLLPGPTFVKSFLRTYAQALGLDGRALVEEYRLSHEHLNETAVEPIVSGPKRPRSRAGPGGRAPGGPSRAYLVAVAAVCLVIVLLLVALLSGGGSSTHPSTSTSVAHSRQRARAHRALRHGSSNSQSAVVSLSLRPKAPVYVCLLGEHGRTLIAGRELQPGTSTPTFHARRFEITLGNASVTMVIDGQGRSVPPSSQAIGYAITKARGRQPLAPGRLPTCK